MRSRLRSSLSGLAAAVLAGSALVSVGLGVRAPSAGAATATFSSNTVIAIPSLGQANPYPSTIPVSGLAGTVTKVTVTLNSLQHTYSADLDVVLRGPTGWQAMLMSDVGGTGGTDSAVTLTFDGAATGALLDSTQFAPGTYVPSASTAEPGTDARPAPGSLDGFAGTNPNGNWDLFIDDDLNGDSGSVQGWSITVTTSAAVTTTTTVVSNPNPVTISSVGQANPYPSTISVAGVPGTVTKVTVTLNSLQHTFSADLDVVLRGPTGRQAMLMSDAGGGAGTDSAVTLTFDGAATTGLTTTGAQFAAGSYVPSDNLSAAGDARPAPPSLGGFVGTNPNGNWDLLIDDDLSNDAGTLASWSITLTTAVFAAPTVTQANITAVTANGVCTATIPAPTPTVTGNPAPTVTITPAWPATHPLGTTNYTATATNELLPDATAPFTVTVTDNQPPVIALPAGLTSPLTVNATSPAGAVVTYPDFTATDNCPGFTVTRTAGPASGATFPMGDTIVTHTATDTTGNTASVSFTVTVLTAGQQITNATNQAGTIGAAAPRERILNLLAEAQRQITAGNTPAACSTLSFLLHLDNARLYLGLTETEITTFKTQATTMRAALACPPAT